MSQDHREQAAAEPAEPQGEPAAPGDPAAIAAVLPTGAPIEQQRTAIIAIPFPEAPVSSGLRKAQVRAALFRKLEPLKIGRFVLLEPLGAGAMGEIYAAYDDQLDRKVALKLVRGGSGLSAKADDRLLREAQTLAQVSHPNVVQIYEAGTYNGRLFIAMELIRGVTLTRRIDDAAALPRAVRLREILRQFIAAGRGLEAAHAAGVAHRDFKPDNVLVGDDGRVRVVDFGLARALGESLGESGPAGAPADADAALAPDTEDDARGVAGEPPLMTGGATIDLPVHALRRAVELPRPMGPGSASQPGLKAALRLTETGTVMGTPSYMAPEQMRGAVADLRSDQFSFCVALYHALYETFPFSGKSLRELKDAMDSGQIAIVPGAAVPAFVRKALLRGLAVEPALRFPSMAELLAALEPAARRSRGRIAGAAALAVVALGAAVALHLRAADPCEAAGAAIDVPWSVLRQTTLHAAFSASELPFAESTWHGVKGLVDDYATRWRGEATAACRATHVAHTQSAELLDRRMACLDRGRRQLAALVGALADARGETVPRALEATEALPELDACSHPENLVFGVAPPPARLAPAIAAIRDQLAHALALELLGHGDAALAIARPMVAAAAGLGYPPVHAEALAQTARSLDGRDTQDARRDAEALYLEAIDLAEAARHDELAVQVWNKLVLLAMRNGPDLTAARAWARRNAAAVHRTGDAGGETAKLHHALSEIAYRDSKYDVAADEARRAIAALTGLGAGAAHPLELSRYDDALAKALERLDGLDEAIALHARARALATAAVGASHPNAIKLAINYGKALEKRGQLAQAHDVLEAALAAMPAADRAAHPDAGRLFGFLSDVEYTEGKLDAAAANAQRSLDVFQRGAADPVLIAAAYTNLGNVELQRRSFDRALALYGEALAVRRRHLGPDHYQIGVTEGSIAEVLVELERHADALPHLVEAERVFARGAGHERATEAWLLTVRGEILVGLHQHAAAVPALERALELGDGAGDPTNHALAMAALGRALHGLGKDPARVRSLAEHALQILTARGAVDAHRRDAVAQLLAQLPH